MKRKISRETEIYQLTRLIHLNREMARVMRKKPDEYPPQVIRYRTDEARQYLFDLIRLTRYKSAIEPVNEAY